MKNVNDASKLIAVVLGSELYTAYATPPPTDADRAEVRAAVEIHVRNEIDAPPDMPIRVVFWDERPTAERAE